MLSLLSIASVLLASTLPTASAAWKKPPPKKDDCDDFIVKELYRKPLGSKSEFDADAYAEAFGENTETYTDLFLLQERGNAFSAYLYGATDYGVVYVYNEGYGATIDCDKVTSLVIEEFTGWKKRCLQRRYKIEEKACTKATAHFVADGYAIGKDAVVVATTDTVTNDSGSGTVTGVYARGSEGAGTFTD